MSEREIQKAIRGALQRPIQGASQRAIQAAAPGRGRRGPGLPPGVLQHGLEIAWSLLVFAWMAAGLAAGNGVDPVRLPSALSHTGLAFVLVTACVWALAAACLFKIASPLIGGRLAWAAAPDRRGAALLSVLASAAAIALIALHLSARAASAAYFSALAPLDYAVAAASIALNAGSLARLIVLINLRDASYREYLDFRKEIDGADGHDGHDGRDGRVLRASIQKRLILSFVGFTLVVIVVLTTVLMSGFSRTILKAVIDNGVSLTDRAASVIKANLGDDIAIGDYFDIEQKKNAAASFRFTSLSFYGRRPGGESYFASHSTDETLLGRELPAVYRGASQAVNRYSEASKTFEFLSPVNLSNVLVGYVLADYDRDLIYEPYFRTQVRVVLVAALSVYLSVFGVYIFGTNIVFPILFLRMSVNRISGTLSGMIRGRVRISAELLRYEDKVPTRDEIKMLSAEIGNMTTVIKGIIPYISASTLKQAERATPTSQAKHLAFLFTDIRGFTGLCEGMAPAQVVEILNHYLDLQANIILQHHGDIDKFVGDAVMGVFDGPAREINACRAAMAIRTAMGRDRELRRSEKRNPISIGIGINSGPVVFGSVGARDRMDFTSIGDTVNLAARLEGANKEYRTKGLISEAVYQRVRNEFLCREIDLLTVKGKTRPVRIYEVLQERGKAANKLVMLADGFEKGLGLYRERQWDAAARFFGPLADKLDDGASRVFLARIDVFRSSPPPRNWSGVFALAVK